MLKHTQSIATLLALFAGFVSCTANLDGPGARKDSLEENLPVRCPSTGTVETFAEGLPDRPEGLAMTPDGRMFVSVDQTGDILEFEPDGTFESVALFASALGLAWYDGSLYVAGINSGRLERWSPDGSTATVGRGLGQANFVTPTPWGTFLVSDDFAGRISEVTPEGVVSLWENTVPSPNGMVFAPDGKTLYVASTFFDDVGLWIVPVESDHQAGKARLGWAFPDSSTPDGVVMDAQGRVYMALNTLGQIVRVDPDVPDRYDIVAEDMGNPASLAFGTGEFGSCWLYATHLLDKVIMRVSVE